MQQPTQPGYPGGPPPPSQEVVSFFSAIDTDRSGELSHQELQRALALGGLNYGLSDIDAMVRAFDSRSRKRLDINEFAQLHNFLMTVTASFTRCAKGAQSLQILQLQQAIKDAGFTLDPPVVQALQRRHDPNADGTITLDEYIRLCLFLHLCVRTFTAFDTTNTGRVTLDFGQFVYACSHV